jgi:hypothetical protein
MTEEVSLAGAQKLPTTQSRPINPAEKLPWNPQSQNPHHGAEHLWVLTGWFTFSARLLE